jgi:hypothetical protein
MIHLSRAYLTIAFASVLGNAATAQPNTAPTKVVITPEHVLSINGRKIFPIGFTVPPPPDAKTPSGNRAINRWAEPDNGNGVSGPPNSVAGALKGVINNNKTPTLGPSDCPWSTNNCGPNDEIFSFHPGGAISVFADGSAHFIDETIEPVALRCLVTRAENDISSWNQ